MFFLVGALLQLTTPETISSQHKTTQRCSINNGFSVRRTYDLNSLRNIVRFLKVNNCLLKLQSGEIKQIRELLKRGKDGDGAVKRTYVKARVSASIT